MKDKEARVFPLVTRITASITGVHDESDLLSRSVLESYDHVPACVPTTRYVHLSRKAVHPLRSGCRLVLD